MAGYVVFRSENGVSLLDIEDLVRQARKLGASGTDQIRIKKYRNRVEIAIPVAVTRKVIPPTPLSQGRSPMRHANRKDRYV